MQRQIGQFLQHLRVERGASPHTLKSYREDLLALADYLADDQGRCPAPASITTGELRSVQSTPMDFRQLTAIGTRIDQDDEQLGYGGGYDHNLALNGGGGDLALAAWVQEPVTGRVMEVYTTEPGVQLYTGNNLDGSLAGKGGMLYGNRSALCLETQHFPDSPNKPGFPSTVLRVGETYRTTTVHKFTVL